MLLLHVLLFYSLYVWTPTSTQPSNLGCTIPELEEAEYKGDYTSQYPGGKLKLDCKENFYKAATYVTCLTDRTWSKPTPPCTLVRCPQPFDPKNGRSDFSKLEYGGKQDVWCNKGYNYTGTKGRQCQRDGTWSGTDGVCKEIECPPLNAPERGRLSSPNVTYQSEISITCTAGYVYNGTTTRQCQADRTWSGRNGSCEEVECPMPGDPPNGRIEVLTRGYKAEATIVCNEGYECTDTDCVRQCLDDNVWSGKTDACQKISCPPLQIVDNGYLSSRVTRYMDHVDLTCQPGYYVDGATNVTCQADGTYSQPLGTCKKAGPSLLYLLFLLLVPGIIAILVIVWWCSPKPKGDGSPDEIELLIKGGKPVHVSFRLNGNTESDVEDGFRDVIKNAVELNLRKSSSEVDVSYTHAVKGFVILVIKCGGCCLEEVKQALLAAEIKSQSTQARMHRIAEDSITFMDPVKATITMAILGQKHVPDHELDKKINLDTEYVDPRLFHLNDMHPMQNTAIAMNQYHNDYYQVYLEKEIGGRYINDNELVTGDGKKPILLRGRAGIGKSTGIRKLFWKWAHGEWGTRFTAVFLLNIKHLLNLPFEVELWQLLKSHSAYPVEEITLDKSWLEKNSGNICIVLDGIDELWDFKKRWDDTVGRTCLDWCFHLLQTGLESATIIVCSRLFADLSLIKSSKVVEIMGLTAEQVKHYVNTNVRHDRVEYVKETLIKNPILLSASAITYSCGALCRELEETDLGTKNLMTCTQINAFLMEGYIKRCLKREFKADMKEELCTMSRLAYQSLKSNDASIERTVFHKSDFMNCKVTDEEMHQAVRIMCQAGIYYETELGSIRDNPLGQFVHLSVQELLAVTGLLLQDSSTAGDAISDVFKAGQFIWAHLYLFGMVFNSLHPSVNAVIGRLGLSEEQMQDFKEPLEKQLLESTTFQIMEGVRVVCETQSESIAGKYVEQKLSSEVTIEGTSLTSMDINALEFTLKNHRGAKLIVKKRQETHTIELTTPFTEDLKKTLLEATGQSLQLVAWPE